MCDKNKLLFWQQVINSIFYPTILFIRLNIISVFILWITMTYIDVYIENNNYFENSPTKQLDNVYIIIIFFYLNYDHNILNIK